MIESDITAEHVYRCVLWDIYSRVKHSIDSRFEDLTDVEFPTYNKDTDGLLNKHHWVFPYVWGTFFPYLAKKLDIPFNPGDFKLVADPEGDSRYDRHLWKGDFICDAYRFRTRSITFHSYRECCAGGGITKYHSVIRYPHESVLYKVDNPPGSSSGRRLLLNCDSMSIPLIPLLLPYFKEILCLDFRYDMGRDDYNKILSFDYTDYACIMYERSYILNKHTGHNLTYASKPVIAHKPAAVPSKRKAILEQIRKFRKR